MVKRFTALALSAIFFCNSLVFQPVAAYGESVPAAVPAVPAFLADGLLLRGMTVDPGKPLAFEFLVERKGAEAARGMEAGSAALIKYFLAGLALPDDQMWVNLSPYEKDRIIPDIVGNII